MNSVYDNDKNVWFGPAMNRAYWLESKKARYPRLIIDPEFATGLFEFNKKNYQQNELQKQLNGEIIKKDDDGVFYLHYLNTYGRRRASVNFGFIFANLCKAFTQKWSVLHFGTDHLRYSVFLHFAECLFFGYSDADIEG